MDSSLKSNLVSMGTIVIGVLIFLTIQPFYERYVGPYLSSPIYNIIILAMLAYIFIKLQEI